MRQYDVSDPFNPRHTGSVHSGGIVRKTAHPGPAAPERRAADGGGEPRRARVYFSNSLYSAGTSSSTPTASGLGGQGGRNADGGGFALDPDFFMDFGEERPHQIRLAGGDSSSDSFCYPS